MKLVFDIETDGLDYTKVWLVVAVDISNGKEYIFTDYDNSKSPLEDFKKLFNQSTVLIGHNIIGFDIPALKKLTGWEPTNQKLVDTFLISQMNDFYRPQNEQYKRHRGVHALDTWGQALGHTKPDDPPWDVWSAEMMNRCVEDVHLNSKLYKHLLTEIKAIKGMSPGYTDAIRLEHEFASCIAEQEVNGWLFDLNRAKEVLKYIAIRMAEIELEIEPQLKDRVMYLDKEPRVVKQIGDGRLDKISRDWFGTDYPTDEVTVGMEYQRSKTQPTDLGSNQAVLDLLIEEGWEPTEWNWKVRIDDNGYKQFIKGAPKITDDSLENMSEDVSELGKMVGEWRMLRSRRGFIENQINNQRPDGRVSCGGFTVGTNTHRMRHRGIVNVPGTYAPLGSDIREMYISPRGYKIVSADSAGNQLRGFAHYLNNSDVSNAIAYGSSEDGTDIHTRNASLVGVPRNIVKNLTYALLFGAGDPKLAKTGGFPESKGKELRAKMMVAYPGFQGVLDDTSRQYNSNKNKIGRGFVFALDGRPIFCEQYKAFNALLQAFEAVTMKEACVQSCKMIKDEGLDAKLVCHYHDEMSFEVAEKDCDRVSQILSYSLGEHITNYYNLNIPMEGDPKIGENWREVH